MGPNKRKWQPPPKGAIVLAELPRDKKGRWIYSCAGLIKSDGRPGCGRSGAWGKGWQWYGSFREWDNGYVMAIRCPKCAPANTKD